MTLQLPLALRWPRRQRFEHFFPGVNAAALAAVQSLSTQVNGAWVYLNGAEGSGKSHLLIAACQAALQAGHTVQYLPLRAIKSCALAIRGVAGSDFLALDDLEAIAGDREAEYALFDIYNQAHAEGARLLFAAASPPAQLGLLLPDLRSRLGACAQYLLKALDDNERRNVLKAQAGLRGIVLEDHVLDWLFIHYMRDLGTLLDLLEKLDYASLAARRKITVPFLRELLRHEQQLVKGKGIKPAARI